MRMLGIPRLFGRIDQLVGFDIPEDILEDAVMLIPEAPGMFGTDILATEGCTLDASYRADYEVAPGCIQVAGPKVPGIDSVQAAEELGQVVASRLRTGC